MRRGQAILETVLAVFFVTLLFLGLFELSLKLNKRIVLDYAAQRVARAKAVGFNRFMCLKIARIATVSIAGDRLWPDRGDVPLSTDVDLGRFPIYLRAENNSRARAILDYEFWHKMNFVTTSDSGVAPKVMARISSAEDDIVGEAQIESHYPYYLESFE